MTSKSYSDGTPTANFFYDETAVTLGSWTSPTLANTKGRLSHTNTISGTVKTATVYSYDVMGRAVDFWQCTPYNCGSASIWNMRYTYNLAGDVTSWRHPGGFTITQSINNAQQITQITSSISDANNPGTLVQSLSYTPFGALKTFVNGCVGAGCVERQETYDYNNRLQPVRIQLGTSAAPNANYCWAYNYDTSLTPPTSCAIPAQGTGNNGNVLGYRYQNSTHLGWITWPATAMTV